MEPVWVTGNRSDERKFFCPITVKLRLVFHSSCELALLDLLRLRRRC